MKRLMMVMMLCMTAAQTFADDINVQILGAITASACDVDTASLNKTVDMGEATARDFSQPYTNGPWVPFELKIINCPTSVSYVDAESAGQADTFDNRAYANTGTGGGVALMVVNNKNGKYLLPGGATISEWVDAASHSATFQLSAFYTRTTQAFTPGSFNSVMQVTFTYR
ncbi:type 1 fimbrial protein [Cronobacter dublinensis]|nr:type 1 fimbrial protein [Cronobacter dublinensis]EKF2293309.1 type 1 fimbrial protein [Cronobacter dublinensis]EKF2297366.1 type 1 fimbrial protein [Cronobacter dublinensis]EKK5268411.1 type 1 fimbrial protein [Cronobacter dublinensis]EKM0137986.1 type 1 fimbrial protein [Cronobacter dublinensis]